MRVENRGQSSRSSVLDRDLDRGLLSVSFDPAKLGMATVSADFLVPGEESPADFFLAMFNKQKRQVEMMPACGKGETFQEKWRAKLKKAEQKKLYVSLEEAPALVKYFDRTAAAVIDNPDATRREKVCLIQEMATLNLQLLFGSDLSTKNLKRAADSAEQTVSQLARDPKLLMNLSAVLKSDFNIYSHCVNACMLAMAFGRQLKLPESMVGALGIGGLLHDVGMTKVPRETLDKEGELTAEEMAKIKQHPRHGYDLLMSIPTVSYDVLMMVLHHHENADGTGYPSGLKAANIPYLARLLRVVDSYDAMTSSRPYHNTPLSPYEAAQTMIANRVEVFGKDTVPAFIGFLGGRYIAHE